MESIDALDREHRDVIMANLERYVYPDELAAELRTVAQLVEGFCVAAEGMSLRPPSW